MQKKYRALLSVSDKAGVVDFAQHLIEMGFEIVSTGGTATLLKQHNVPVTLVSEITQFPEIMDGRVKTLHPYIYAGILSRQNNAEDEGILQQLGLQIFDLVVVNLYPFVKTVEKSISTTEEIVENIDIGGPSMIRAAAKNHSRVAVVVDPKDYSSVLKGIKQEQGLSFEQRIRLAAKAFSHCAAYDASIASWFEKQTLAEEVTQNFSDSPAQLRIVTHNKQALRYGENPHQKGAFYRLKDAPQSSIACIKQHQGKPLSYNNIMDSDVALELVKQLDKCACVIVKHSCPCGVAQSESVLQSYKLAYACDSESAFGGIISFNNIISLEEAKYIVSKQFFEIIIAPQYTQEAIEFFAQKENVRVLQYDAKGAKHLRANDWEMRQVNGGFLYQQCEYALDKKYTVVTKKQPDEAIWEELDFSWDIVRAVKSNAIVCTRGGQTLGIGGGQTSRVMAAELAYIKSQKAGVDWSDAVMASDAFFPFKDSIEFAGERGIKAIIQPGGSIRDKEVIAMADFYNMSMVFTHYRCFKH
jgi:phosphoribosylaminoimidazolecarboxamide formyltransferase/IMP cyclohydrolase